MTQTAGGRGVEYGRGMPTSIEQFSRFCYGLGRFEGKLNQHLSNQGAIQDPKCRKRL